MATKRWLREKRKNSRMELLRSVMRKYPDQVAVEIIERHLMLKQPFTEIAQVLGLHRHTVEHKYHRVLPILKEIVKCREKK